MPFVIKALRLEAPPSNSVITFVLRMGRSWVSRYWYKAACLGDLRCRVVN